MARLPFSLLFLALLLSLLDSSLAVNRKRPQGPGPAPGKTRREACCPEKAQARAVKIVQEWSSYVNTGNIQFLINNYIQVGAAVVTTGTVNSNLCNVVTADLGKQLANDVAAGIKGDVLTIKEVKFLPKSGHVEVFFTMLQGIEAANMTMVSAKWLFKSHTGCDYRVAEQTNTFFPCL